MHHVIIGAGPAGVIAAEHLRKLDAASQITILGDEPEPPYSRMAIPYLLIDRIAEQGTYLRKSAEHFDRLKIDVSRDKVTGVDAENKRLTTENNASLRFDRLLIASGAHPVAPPIPGLDAPGVHTCWTLADAREIARLAGPQARVVQIGAGFIGSIIMEALLSRGVQLTVVELEERMVPRMSNAVSSALIKRWCEAKGVKVYTSTAVEAIAQGDGDTPLKVKLNTGELLAADLVINATGVKSNIEFLQGSGIETDEGVRVDRQLQTNKSGVFAAGDVAQGIDFSTGEYSVQAIQPTAVEHGRIAAGNMTGHTQAHRGSLAMNVLDTMGLVSSSFGMWMGVDGGETAELIDETRFRYLNLQFEDDILVGASSLGLTEHIGVVRGLIQSKIRLKDWKQKLMRDPTRLMEAYIANTQAIEQQVRVA
jgi:NADPH-dependent 2,4-dienoyl-CoA reductase/sulfur reductase-like enzyme